MRIKAVQVSRGFARSRRMPVMLSYTPPATILTHKEATGMHNQHKPDHTV
jgi:hypothetical protein